MVGYIWAAMIISSVVFGAFSGEIPGVSDAMLGGASDGFELFLIMAAVMCFWNGLMNVASSGGFSRLFALALRPLTRLVFPNIPPGSKAVEAISMNISANMLGLGNAATPLGICAMQELKKLSVSADTASRDMIFFVVLNSVSVQLVPTGVASIRAAAGSQAPLRILPAVFLSSVGSAAIGLLLSAVCSKLADRKKAVSMKAQVV